MKKSTKVWLITAGALVAAGCVLFAGVMLTIGRDISKLSTVRYETNTHEVTEPFDDIALTTDTADISFALSDDGKCTVECYEEENAKHSVAVENNTLVIKVVHPESWRGYIGFDRGSPKITVYLPKAEYKALTVNGSTGRVEIPQELALESADISLSTGDAEFRASVSGAVRINASTGYVRVENTAAASLDISVTTGMVTVSGVTCEGTVTVGVSTGEAYLTDVSCKDFISSGSTGDIVLSNVIAAGKLSVDRSTGYVRFDKCDAAELYVETDTGDVTGSLLSDKVFITDTDTGDVDVPKTASGGRCEIRTDTGDIKIEVG